MEKEQIIRTEYSDIMQKSYIDYAMSVIVARALPDVRDGLKPVQRRTLYDMYELGIRYDRPYRKCARIVGDTMGKYHPHGDSSIYEALVVMAQDFKKGLPLVDGHGNFGSIEGDGAAAMRYTEARLQKITQEIFLGDLDKDVVDFVPNFDETEKEPSVLPVRVPNILVNGSDGIAVGMVTSIPPHNLGEVIDAVKAVIRNNQITNRELMEYIKGPDFPTGGIVVNKDDLLSIYETGTGKISKNADVDNLINMLYKKTRLEDTFGVNMLAVAGGKPETLSLKSIIDYHVDFQFELATRKYRTLLNKELAKKEIQEGLIKACDCIDLIIEILRGSKSQKQVKECLVNGVTEGIRFKTKASEKAAKTLRFTENQATAILEMRLYKLIGLEIEALMKEHEATLANIDRYQDILNNYKSMARVIIKELDAVKKEYAVPRKTGIENAAEAVFEEKKVEEMEVVFLMDRFGYARTVDKSVYERNKEAADAESKYVLSVMNTDKISILTDSGRQHLIKVLDLPYGKFRDKGKPIDNLCNYDSSSEQVVAVESLQKLKYAVLLLATKKGMLKQMEGIELDVAKRCIAATKLNEDDALISVELLGEYEQIVLQTHQGFFLRFPVGEIPMKKKNAVGVRGMKLADDDFIENVYYLTAGGDAVALYKEKEVHLNRLRIGKRDTKGVKTRI